MTEALQTILDAIRSKKCPKHYGINFSLCHAVPEGDCFECWIMALSLYLRSELNGRSDS